MQDTLKEWPIFKSVAYVRNRCRSKFNHKFTLFLDVMTDLYNWINPKTLKHSPMISKQTYDLIKENSEVRVSCFLC